MCPFTAQFRGHTWAHVVGILILQIVTNLIQNAAIHAFSGRSQGLISITATAADGDIVLKVQDDGNGMDARTAKHAFDPFFTTRLGRGSGLGLSIWYRIATVTLGGSLTLESEVGQGRLTPGDDVADAQVESAHANTGRMGAGLWVGIAMPPASLHMSQKESCRVSGCSPSFLPLMRRSTGNLIRCW